MRKSLRNTIVREMVGNTLMHREFTSSYTAKFVIEKNQMYVENANRASKHGYITMDNLEPNPKNPVIAAFFRNIGYADQLGSGVRNLFKYAKFYSGKNPEFKESDIFRIVVPLDEDYSYDFSLVNQIKEAESVWEVPESAGKMIKNAGMMPESAGKMIKNAGMILGDAEKIPESAGMKSSKRLLEEERKIVEHVKNNGEITSFYAAGLLDLKQRRARVILSGLCKRHILQKQGKGKNTVYTLFQESP